MKNWIAAVIVLFATTTTALAYQVGKKAGRVESDLACSKTVKAELVRQRLRAVDILTNLNNCPDHSDDYADAKCLSEFVREMEELETDENREWSTGPLRDHHTSDSEEK